MPVHGARCNMARQAAQDACPETHHWVLLGIIHASIAILKALRAERGGRRAQHSAVGWAGHMRSQAPRAQRRCN